jgi:uncharacterized protein YdhG (YjbR/CyaY superfamily)
MTTTPATIAEYVAGFDEPVRGRLEEALAAIRAAVPGTEESIQYSMAAFRFPNGRPVFLAAWKQHISLHAVPGFDGPLEDDVAPLRSGKDTVRFSHRRPLPTDLIARIAAATAAIRSD